MRLDYIAKTSRGKLKDSFNFTCKKKLPKKNYNTKYFTYHKQFNLHVRKLF